MEVILASASPRRHELLNLIGLEHRVLPSRESEKSLQTSPEAMVSELAFKKGASVKQMHKNCCVISADTIVYLNGEIIGKPRDASDAIKILKKLSGNTHAVYTGLAVLTDDFEEVCFDRTSVTFCRLSDEEIQDYVASKEPLDKAGAYGVQGLGGVLVERIDGCYFNVVGLPLPKLYQMLKNAIPDFNLLFPNTAR